MSYEYTEELLRDPPTELIRNGVERLGLGALAVEVSGQQTWARAAMTMHVPVWAYTFALEYKAQWDSLLVLEGSKAELVVWGRLLRAIDTYVRWHVAKDRLPEAVQGLRALAACAYFHPDPGLIVGTTDLEASALRASWKMGPAAMLQSVAETLDLWNASRWRLED